MVHPDCYNLKTWKSKYLGFGYAFATGLLSSFNILFSKVWSVVMGLAVATI